MFIPVYPVYLGSQLSTNIATTSASITINYPTNSNPGDYIVSVVQFLQVGTTSYTITTPSGWVALPNAQENTSTSDGIASIAMGKTRGTETSVVVTCTLATNMYSTGMAMAFLGSTVNQAAPVNISQASYTLSSSTTCSAPTATTTAAHCSLSAFSFSIVSGSNTSFSYTWGSGMTADVNSATFNSGPNATFGNTCSNGTLLGPAATGALSCTSSTSTVARLGVTVGIAPAVASPLLSPPFNYVQAGVRSGSY